MDNLDRDSLFSVMYLDMDRTDKENRRYWDMGIRYVVQQLDGDNHYFKTKRRADAFLTLHGLNCVNIPEMMALRNREGL